MNRLECAECGATVHAEDVLWTEHGQATCSDSCRDLIDGPEA